MLVTKIVFIEDTESPFSRIAKIVLRDDDRRSDKLEIVGTLTARVYKSGHPTMYPINNFEEMREFITPFIEKEIDAEVKILNAKNILLIFEDKADLELYGDYVIVRDISK